MFKPIHGSLAFLLLLLLISPWARVYEWNLMLLVGLFMAISYLSGSFVFQIWRNAAMTILFLRDTKRESFATGKLAESEEIVDSKLPGVSIIGYGGYDSVVSFPDPHIAVLPTSSLEMLGAKTLLCYSPTVKLETPATLKGVFGIAATLGEDSNVSSFKATKKSHSHARIGWHNSLLQVITTEEIQSLNRVINKSGVLQDLVVRAVAGEASLLSDLQAMIKVRTKGSRMQSMKKFVLGDKAPSEHPEQRSVDNE